MKRILCFALALCLILGTLPVSAAAAFSPVRDYPNYTDMPADHWGYDYVRQCSTLGLMVGTTATEFAPGGNLTLAQAITAAARVADMYRGGDGVIDQSGDNWYDGAVEMAIKYDMMDKNEFDSYTRNATRAELAGLLGRAMPKKEYAAINDIDVLPDVDKSTPYSKEIFALYNAGIVTGSDKYGTFTPHQSITRVELSAILCRLVLPETRVAFTPMDKSLDPTIRSTDKLLLVDGKPVPGIVEIGGRHYIAMESLIAHMNGKDSSYYMAETDTEFQVSLKAVRNDITILDIANRPKAGVVIGQGELSAKSVEIDGEYYSGKDVWTLGGSYPMVALDAMGAKKQGNDYYLEVGPKDNYALAKEYDMVGAIVPSLQKSTPRETVRALHDYLVGAIDYDPRFASYTGEGYEYLDEPYAAAREKYDIENNQTLEFGYGICEDYADIFQYMCLLSNIPCRLVTGSARGPHAWNQVYVDGQWLYVDCTWDDPVNYHTIDHEYFLISADDLAKSHYWDGYDYPLPKEYDPAWEQLDPMNITSRDMFRKCLLAQLNMGVNPVKLRVTKSGAYGGTGCLYSGLVPWWSCSGGYSNGMYIYHFNNF